MSCRFCQIVRGEREDKDVKYRGPRFIVIAPATGASGKLLIVPVTHYESLDVIDFADLGGWLQEARKLASRLRVGKFKMQINVGNDQGVTKHIYMQFSYQTAESQKERNSCQHLSMQTASASPQEKPDQVLLPATARLFRTT